MPDNFQINSTEMLVIFLSAISYFILFILTSLLNYIDLKRGKIPDTHLSSLLAGKIVNVLFILVLLMAGLYGLVPSANFFDYLYLIICINIAIKINWNLFAATDCSMHVRLLTLIKAQKNISHNELLKQYNRNEIINVRIPRLLALNQIQIVNERYVLSGKFVLFGGMLLAFFRLVLGLPVRPANNN